jgi:hypothetical protein
MDRNNNEDLFPYPGNTTSRVWKYFFFKKKKDGAPVKDNLEMSRVICTLCRKSYANNGMKIRIPHPQYHACYAVTIILPKIF